MCNQDFLPEYSKINWSYIMSELYIKLNASSTECNFGTKSTASHLICCEFFAPPMRSFKSGHRTPLLTIRGQSNTERTRSSISHNGFSCSACFSAYWKFDCCRSSQEVADSSSNEKCSVICVAILFLLFLFRIFTNKTFVCRISCN